MLAFTIHWLTLIICLNANSVYCPSCQKWDVLNLKYGFFLFFLTRYTPGQSIKTSWKVALIYISHCLSATGLKWSFKVQREETGSHTQVKLLKHYTWRTSVLGPKLFSWFINDTCKVSDTLKLVVYADDKMFFCSGDYLQLLPSNLF